MGAPNHRSAELIYYFYALLAALHPFHALHSSLVSTCHDSEAHNCGQAWVRFWMHTGHLYIKGRKMSKSLKNFITIKDYFAASLSSQPTADFRVMCLQQRYSSSLHYSPERIDEAVIVRQKLENFYNLAGTALAAEKCASHSEKETGGEGGGVNRYGDSIIRRDTREAKQLRLLLDQAKIGVREALCNDFDTPEALRVLLELASSGGQYASLVIQANGVGTGAQNEELASTVQPGGHPIEPLASLHRFISKMLMIFGFKIRDFMLGKQSAEAPSVRLNVSLFVYYFLMRHFYYIIVKIVGS
jgi:hypothetical protein